jgi:uncharacterized protein
MGRVHPFKFAVLLMFALGAASCAAQGDSCPAGPDQAAIVSADGEHCFTVEIAGTPEEFQRGLMFVRHMEPDKGMLFLFDRTAIHSFWMKNTYISLDIIFIGPNGRIVDIAPRTEPLSEESISPPTPVSAVLEINGGLSEKLGIRAGDTVRHPALGAQTGQRAQ